MTDTFVLDCSVAAKWVLPEPDRPIAMKWLDRHWSGEIILIAPDLILVEFASLITKRWRQRTISVAEARTAFAFMMESAPQLFDTRPLLPSALELSLEHQISVWDCVYLALALEHNCPVLTADVRLFRAGRSRHPSIRLMRGN
jgi:predicted nucleic acid-binding protein